jgi:hypothetical protein
VEHLIKAELIRFSRILLSYTKTVIGGMIVFLVVSILWSGLSLFSREAQVLVGILLIALLLMFLITRLVPLSIPKKTTEEKDWLLNELGLTSRDVAELGSVGAVLAWTIARGRTHNQPAQVDLGSPLRLQCGQVELDFPLRVQMTKREEKAEGPGNRVTKAFVMSKQDFGVFLDDIDQLLKIVVLLGNSGTQTLRPRLRPKTLQSHNFGLLPAFVALPARLMESAPARSHVILLLKENHIKSELCRWTIETGSVPVEEIELTVGYQTSDKKESVPLDI